MLLHTAAALSLELTSQPWVQQEPQELLLAQSLPYTQLPFFPVFFIVLIIFSNF